jgi:hypothetical protein
MRLPLACAMLASASVALHFDWPWPYNYVFHGANDDNPSTTSNDDATNDATDDSNNADDMIADNPPHEAVLDANALGVDSSRYTEVMQFFVDAV